MLPVRLAKAFRHLHLESSIEDKVFCSRTHNYATSEARLSISSQAQRIKRFALGHTSMLPVRLTKAFRPLHLKSSIEDKAFCSRTHKYATSEARQSVQTSPSRVQHIEYYSVLLTAT